ncbi:MAG: hypothetical protein ACLFUS_00100 [Candidatus Sumerlaeia bacterium]
MPFWLENVLQVLVIPLQVISVLACLTVALWLIYRLAMRGNTKLASDRFLRHVIALLFAAAGIVIAIWVLPLPDAMRDYLLGKPSRFYE